MMTTLPFFAVFIGSKTIVKIDMEISFYSALIIPKTTNRLVHGFLPGFHIITMIAPIHRADRYRKS